MSAPSNRAAGHTVSVAITHPIEVKLPFPVSLNDRYAYRGSKRLSGDYQSFKDEVGYRTNHHRPVAGPIAVSVSLVHRHSNRMDVDNYCKALLDALEGRLYENDRQIVRLTVQKYVTAGDNHCIVSVRGYDTGVIPYKERQA